MMKLLKNSDNFFYHLLNESFLSYFKQSLMRLYVNSLNVVYYLINVKQLERRNILNIPMEDEISSKLTKSQFKKINQTINKT